MLSGVAASNADAHIGLFAGGAGQGDLLVENDARATQLSNPAGLAISSDRSVFISDRDNHRVLKVTEGRRVSVFVGGVGQGNRVTENNPPDTQLDCPHGLAIDSDGAVFIADYENNRVLKVSSAGDTVSVFAGGPNWGKQPDPNDPRNT